MLTLGKTVTRLNISINCDWSMGKFDGQFLPCVKLFNQDNQYMLCSIEINPKLISNRFSISASDLDDFEAGRVYVGNNYEAFMEYFQDRKTKAAEERLLKNLTTCK